MSNGKVMQFRGTRVLGLSDLRTADDVAKIASLEQACKSVVGVERAKVVGSVISEVSTAWTAAMTDVLTMPPPPTNEVAFRLEDCMIID